MQRSHRDPPDSAEDARLLDEATERVLSAGADSRALLGTGSLTRYGTRSTPRSAVPFGSCTASSPIERVYRAAELGHAALRQAACRGRLEQEIQGSYREVVRGLRDQLSLAEAGSVEIALTPSGTDAEYLALLLALGDAARPLCNVIVGPKEVGTGTEGAAGGYHFDTVTPHGPGARIGVPVCQRVTERVEVRTIHLRNETGGVREPDELDHEADAVVTDAVGRGFRVLLHIVAHSKTGIHAPSLNAVRRLRAKYRGDILVVIDAAQGRVSRRGLIGALREDSLVLFTGSKFYGGPSFSGAVLVPRAWDPCLRRIPPIPAEFSSYFSRWELPERWAEWTGSLRHRFNLGLLLRWIAGHEAARAYYQVPGLSRFSILRCFEDFVPRDLANSPWVELDSVEPVHFPAGAERLLESKTTVFPFRVRSSQNRPPTYLGNEDLKRVAQWLNQDISHLMPEAGPRVQQLLCPCYHLGQPVFKGDARHPAVLRIALGAALVTEVGLNVQYGEVLDDRLMWLQRQVHGALAKLHFIAEHFSRLAREQERRAP